MKNRLEAVSSRRSAPGGPVGISNFRWHDLRHTFASRLRQAGVPLGTIAELLGHKGLAMTQRYAHLAISNLHAAVSRLECSTAVAPDVAEAVRIH